MWIPGDLLTLRMMDWDVLPPCGGAMWTGSGPRARKRVTIRCGKRFSYHGAPAGFIISIQTGDILVPSTGHRGYDRIAGQGELTLM